ncbi:putative DNA topoisomerase [Xylophilus phage Lumi]|nr:putative DNA topoisomerase [Xylophilus phage Lumi]
MRQQYTVEKFTSGNRDKIAVISSILNEYIKAGYKLTVRTLYYQMVARGFIPNNEREYKMITNLVSKARNAGLLDWDAITDGGRAFIANPHWESGKQILEGAAEGFDMDHWENQDRRVFCIIEKDALRSIVRGTCSQWDVPLMAAKGYPSASVVRDFVKYTCIPAADAHQHLVLLHMGDHDPSGIDMSRDLEERINLYGEGRFRIDFRRIALNMEQIEEQSPPPNPAKARDPRFLSYSDQFGDESWELDALTPQYTNSVLSDAIQEHLDQDAWDIKQAQIDDVKDELRKVAENFDK